MNDGSIDAIRNAQVFVAVPGASNYTYIEDTWSQQLPGWTGSHVHALAYFGDCTELWVPDNLRSGASKASRYEPNVNPKQARPGQSIWRGLAAGAGPPAQGQRQV